MKKETRVRGRTQRRRLDGFDCTTLKTPGEDDGLGHATPLRVTTPLLRQRTRHSERKGMKGVPTDE